MRHATYSYNTAQKRRTAYAKELFDEKRIETWINQRALDGFYHLRLYQKKPLDLSQTEPAKTLMLWLTRNGYDHEWMRTIDPCEPTRPKGHIEYHELLIRWS